MIEIIQWLATAATITAALMTASNLGARVTGFGFAVFLVGSILWLTAGILTDQQALMWTNIVLSVLNLFGIWRWLGRQAKVEQGAREAADTSAERASASLFPASMLSSADVRSADERLGTCVDAMIGSEDGRLRYIVVSEGGVAGVGETLRRLDWSNATVEGDQVRVSLSRSEFEALDVIERDQWPAR